MTIRISADSTCDLSREYIQAHHISIMPLTVTMGGRDYTDGVDIAPDELIVGRPASRSYTDEERERFNDTSIIFLACSKAFNFSSSMKRCRTSFSINDCCCISFVLC